MKFCKGLLIAAVATGLLKPATAFAEPGAGKEAPRAKIKVHPKRLWRGYGFLPGYRPSLAESQGIPIPQVNVYREGWLVDSRHRLVGHCGSRWRDRASAAVEQDGAECAEERRDGA